MNTNSEYADERRRPRLLIQIPLFTVLALLIWWGVWMINRPEPVSESPAEETTSAAEVATWLKNATRLDRRGRQLEAIELYRKVLAAEPTSTRSNTVRHRLIEALVSVGDGPGARSEIEALARQPLTSEDRVRLLIHRSRCNRLEGRPREALGQLNEALSEIGFMTEAVCERGLIHFDLGNMSAAVKDLEKVVRANPDHEVAHYKLARAYRRLKLTEAADRHYREYQRIHHKNVRASDFRPY